MRQHRITWVNRAVLYSDEKFDEGPCIRSENFTSNSDGWEFDINDVL